MQETTPSEPSAMERTIDEIALQTLGIETLETRRSDSLDFHDLAVWKIRQALEAAYRRGGLRIRTLFWTAPA